MRHLGPTVRRMFIGADPNTTLDPGPGPGVVPSMILVPYPNCPDVGAAKASPVSSAPGRWGAADRCRLIVCAEDDPFTMQVGLPPDHRNIGID